MTQPEHLKPDEIEMLQRAEKATKGPWTKRGCPSHPGESAAGLICNVLRDSYDEKVDALPQNIAFIAAARTDLPTILTRLANERAKLAIAIEALGALSLDAPMNRQVRAIQSALARINELEKQHGKT